MLENDYRHTEIHYNVEFHIFLHDMKHKKEYI